MADVYPSRPQFFAHKFERLLARCCAAQEVTAAGCWLLSIIAHCEDAKGYRGPVTYWTEQLLPLVGLQRWRQLDAVRQKCIDAGWLHYEPGGTRQVGRYWVTIPPQFQGLHGSDTSCDASIMVDFGVNSGVMVAQSCGNSGGNSGGNPGVNSGYPSSPSQSPSQEREKEPAAPTHPQGDRQALDHERMIIEQPVEQPAKNPAHKGWEPTPKLKPETVAAVRRWQEWIYANEGAVLPFQTIEHELKARTAEGWTAEKFSASIDLMIRKRAKNPLDPDKDYQKSERPKSSSPPIRSSNPQLKVS